MNNEKKMRVIKLSKEVQKKIQGGLTPRVGGCSSWSCIGAFDRHLTHYYKNN